MCAGLLVAQLAGAATVPPAALYYRAALTREAQFIFGIQAPVPTLAAQIEQESGWKATITAWDSRSQFPRLRRIHHRAAEKIRRGSRNCEQRSRKQTTV